MNFTIAWVIGIISIVLGAIAAIAWASESCCRRKEAEKGK